MDPVSLAIVACCVGIPAAFAAFAFLGVGRSHSSKDTKKRGSRPKVNGKA